jgi:hypothetical protein
MIRPPVKEFIVLKINCTILPEYWIDGLMQ